MIYRVLLFMIMVAQVSCVQTTIKNQAKPFAFVDSVLQKDKITAEILDFNFSPEIEDIMLRFQKSMAENKEWAEEYFSKNYVEGEGLPYHEKLGISREEYQKIKDIKNTPPTVVVKKEVPVNVNRSSGNITFSTSYEEIKFIESLKIDFKKQAVLFNNDVIPFLKEINAPASTPFGEWHGYMWQSETSNMGEKDDLKIDSLTSRIIEIDFGSVKLSGKTILRIKHKEVEKGKVNANLDIAFYLK